MAIPEFSGVRISVFFSAEYRSCLFYLILPSNNIGFQKHAFILTFLQEKKQIYLLISMPFTS